MPLIDISLVAGRSSDKKRALIKTVTEAVEESLGTPRSSIRVLIREVAPEHWAVGGVPKSEVPPK